MSDAPAGAADATADAVELFAERAAPHPARLPADRRQPAAVTGALPPARRHPARPGAGGRAAAGALRRSGAGAARRPLPAADRRRPRALPPRHQTLRTAIGWSHELCTPPERLLWARLSVFAGEFDLEAAEYVCSGDGPARRQRARGARRTGRPVGGLARTGRPRACATGMLDTLREYGAEWLAALGRRRSGCGAATATGTWAWPPGASWTGSARARPEVAARTESALPNLRAALEFCLDEPGRPIWASTWRARSGSSGSGCGRLAEGRHWLDRALARPNGRIDPSRLKALWVLGLRGAPPGRRRSARSRRCTSAARRRSERRPPGRSPTRCTGWAAWPCVRTTCRAPRSCCEGRSAATARLGELNSNVLMAQTALAMALAFQGELEAAVELCEEVWQICEDHGERWALAYALYAWGYAAWLDGDPGRPRGPARARRCPSHTLPRPGGRGALPRAAGPGHRGDGRSRRRPPLLQGAAAADVDTSVVPAVRLGRFSAPRERCRQSARRGTGRRACTESLVREGRTLSLDAAVQRVAAPRRGVRRRRRRAPREPSAARRRPDTREPAGSPTAQGGETAG